MLMVMVLYLFQLLVPCALIADVFLAWHADNNGRADLPIVIGAGAWLILGLAPLLLCRDRRRYLARVAPILISLYSIQVTILAMELVLRLTAPSATSDKLYPPGMKWSWTIDPNDIPGYNGSATFTVNELGLRGSSLPTDGPVHKILAVGGSTTACWLLDDSDTWPQLLMQALNEKRPSVRTWVGNAGVNGHAAAYHPVLLRELSIVRQMDTILFLDGFNDLGTTIIFEGAPTNPEFEGEAANFRETLLSGRHFQRPYFKRMYLYCLLRRVVLESSKVTGFNFKEHGPPEWRRKRLEAQVLPLPDLRVGLEEYAGRVRTNIRECRALGVRPIFLTQPTLWRSDMRPEEEALLCGGWVGRWPNRKGHVSTADSARAMDRYNRTLQEACRQEGVECFDLAAVVPKDRAVFFDDVHFNPAGSRLIAARIAEYLLSRPSFGK